MQRGTVGERPWGLTLASFAEARSEGQLTITADDGRLYCVVFARGAIVGASSPLSSDSAARIALTLQLVPPTQVPALARAVATASGRDESDVVASAAGLGPEQAERLRSRLLLQRAARTFSVERGGYVFSEQITVATAPGIEVDVGPAIFLGARMNLSEERLAADLRSMGARFVLRSGEVDAARFGFTQHEQPILNALRIGTSLPDLEAKRRELEPRLTQAVIYTLVATGLCDGLPAPRTRELSPLPPLGTSPGVPVSTVAAGSAPTATSAPLELDAADLLEAAVAAAEAELGLDGAPDWEETTLSGLRTTTYEGPGLWGRTEPGRARTLPTLPPAGLGAALVVSAARSADAPRAASRPSSEPSEPELEPTAPRRPLAPLAPAEAGSSETASQDVTLERSQLRR